MTAALDPAELYARNWAEEQAGTPTPSPLRALAVTLVQLAAYWGADLAELGDAAHRAIAAHMDAV